MKRPKSDDGIRIKNQKTGAIFDESCLSCGTGSLLKHEFSVISGQKYPQEDAYALIFKDETGVEIEYAARIIRVIPPINTVPINRFVFIVPEWDAE